MLPLPDFFEPKHVGELFLERAGRVADAAESFAKAHNLKPASEDRVRIAAFGIDVQVAFCTPGASLFVPGAVEDTSRTLSWLYGNLDKITSLHFSLDTHRVFQIFHPSWWLDEQGRHPAPFTNISHAEVKAGKWRAREHAEASLEYTRKLEANGRYVLTVWPYHALLGGLSHALVPAMYEASVFHALARKQPTHLVTKGEEPLTENYSVLSPEVTEISGKKVGTFNQAFFDELITYDRVYVFGQAKSHCVLSTLVDLREHIQSTNPKLADRVWILEDAMSPVPPPPIDPLPDSLNFPAVAERAMRDFASAGMHVVKTTDPIAL
jgi:nicotinamidase-related amidase